MKHTPRPWKIEHHTLQDGKGGEKFALVYADKVVDGRFEDRVVIASNLKDWNEEQRANIRLIAAVPDLLEACEEMMAVLENVDFPSLNNKKGYDGIPFEKWEKALSKAKGGE